MKTKTTDRKQTNGQEGTRPTDLIRIENKETKVPKSTAAALLTNLIKAESEQQSPVSKDSLLKMLQTIPETNLRYDYFDCIDALLRRTPQEGFTVAYIKRLLPVRQAFDDREFPWFEIQRRDVETLKSLLTPAMQWIGPYQDFVEFEDYIKGL